MGEDKKSKTTTSSSQKPTVKMSEAAYCNLIGATKNICFVSRFKFRGSDTKTESQWKKLFQSEGIL